MAINPTAWTTGAVKGDEKFTSADQIRSRIAAIRDNRGLDASDRYDNYWVKQITSGKASIGDARTALTDKARESLKPVPKVKKPTGGTGPKRKPGKNTMLDLTASQLRDLMMGRRTASTDFKTAMAELNAQKQRGLSAFGLQMAELQRQFGVQRDNVLRELGGRGMASQPMFGGRAVQQMRNDEMAQAGALEMERAQLLAETAAQRQRAKETRDALLADIAALEASYRSDNERIMGGAGGVR